MNKNNILRNFIRWAALLYVLDLCWVGAEYLYEGVVHSSRVDGLFCALLAYLIMREMNRYE